MKVFTYNDYIKSIHTLRLNAVIQLAEENKSYGSKKTHDKLAKIILKNKDEVAKFINNFINPMEKIEGNNLIKYTNSFINRRYKYKEADLVYKLKDREIFFLIEHQSSIDYNMPSRLMNYCIDIIYEWSRNNNMLARKKEYPIVVPIVVYTGKEKWIIPKNFSENQRDDYTYNDYKIRMKYNLIEINNIPNQILLNEKSLFGYGMILEKSKGQDMLKENVELILKNNPPKHILEKLQEIFVYLLSSSIEDSFREEMVEKIEIKIKEGVDENMSCLQERLVKEFRQEIRKELKDVLEEKNRIKEETNKMKEETNKMKEETNKMKEETNKMKEEKNRMKEEQKKTIKRLILYKVSDQIILDSTKISPEELEKMKKENV